MTEYVLTAAGMIQAFNLMLCAYLLRRIDRADENLLDHIKEDLNR